MERGEAAIRMTKAVADGKDFPAAGVPDTPRNRTVFAMIKAEVAALPPGQTPEIPFDQALM